jgi:hypothetical protein
MTAALVKFAELVAHLKIESLGDGDGILASG